MSKQTVNIGQSANDRQGDNLRTAFAKINQNFNELYTALGLDADTTLNLGNFVFEENTVRLTNANNDDSTATTIEIAQPVRVESDLTVGGDVVPNTDLGGNLGSPTKRFKDLYLSGNTITLGSETISSDTGKIVLSGAVEASSLTVTSLAGGNTADWDTAFSWGDHSVAGYISNTSLNPNDLQIQQDDGAITIQNTNVSNPGSGGGSDITINSVNNAVNISSSAYIQLLSGPIGGPYADLDMYGGPITTYGNLLAVASDETQFNGSGTVYFNQDVDFTGVTVTGLNAGVDLTAFSVGAEASASGDGGIAYDNSTGVFTYTPPDLSGYQATLVSGTNIKTINGSSVLGSGDIVIAGGASLPTVVSNKITASRQELTTSSSYTATALTITVTPSSVTAPVFVTFNFNAVSKDTESDSNLNLQLYQDGVAVTDSELTQILMDDQSTSYATFPITYSYAFVPGTTSATVLTLYAKNGGGYRCMIGSSLGNTFQANAIVW